MKKAEDGKWRAQQLNRLGEIVKQEGFLWGYQNHEIEFLSVDGKISDEILISETNPALVWFYIDVGSLTCAGADALHCLGRFKYRYLSIHV